MRIGIIYIATGIYTEFWKEFYPTCESFFCMDAQKGYEVFTDSPKLLSMKFHNTYLHPIEDRGFIVNVSSKSKFICEIASELERKYDYVFYLNGNYKFVEPILSHEILPGPENNYLTVLGIKANLLRNCPMTGIRVARLIFLSDRALSIIREAFTGDVRKKCCCFPNGVLHV